MEHKRIGESGQATVEYVVVAVALIVTVVVLGALWRFFSDGRATQLIEAHASHAVAEEGGLVDALLF